MLSLVLIVPVPGAGVLVGVRAASRRAADGR
ncbi:hypothetical protein FHR89_002761 [Cellulomonas uda]|nr:hypothetical protein [Cellulomonas uda]